MAMLLFLAMFMAVLKFCTGGCFKMMVPEIKNFGKVKRIYRHLIIVTVLFILFAECACDDATAGSYSRISAAAVPNGDGACQILITVGQSQFDVQLDVQASVEPGIIIAANGSQQSDRRRVELLPQDERIVPFDCSLDPGQIGGSGEYVVRAAAFIAGTDQLYGATDTTLMVVQSANGSFRVLPTPQADPIFSRQYRMGQMDVGCDISLENTDQPDAGMIYFKVDSSYDGYAPELILETQGGIQFLDGEIRSLPIQSISAQRVDVQFGSIMDGGSRIIYIPFAIDSNSLAGRYNIRQTIIYNGVSKVENATVSIRIVEEGGSKWIVEEENSAPVLSEPAVLQGAGSAGIGSGQVAAVQITPTATELIEIVPASSSTTVPPTPEPVPTDEPQLLLPQKTGDILRWRYRLTGFYGNRWELWNSFVRTYSGMEWTEFKDWVVIYNPELAADEYVFYPQKSYWLPEKSN